MPVRLVSPYPLDTRDFPQCPIKDVIVVERDTCDFVVDAVACKLRQFFAEHFLCLSLFDLPPKASLQLRKEEAQFIACGIGIIGHGVVEATHQALDMDLTTPRDSPFSLQNPTR